MDELTALKEVNFWYWAAGCFAILEFGKWLFSIKDFILKTIGIKTKGMLKREEIETRLKRVEDSIEEIKNTSKTNVEMFLEHERQVVEKITAMKSDIIYELNKLHSTIDEHKEEADKTDCAMLRDRIASGMRYFSGNVGPDGKVHIKFSDYENMDALFQEYFSKDGNGPFEKMYEDEFKHFVIDR